MPRCRRRAPGRGQGRTGPRRLCRLSRLAWGFLIVAAWVALGVAGGAWADTAFISFSNNDNYVEEFSTTGTSGINTDLGPLPGTTTDTGTPNGVALDSQGNLYVANDNNNTVGRFAPNGTYLGVFASGLNQPAGDRMRWVQ